MSVPVEVTGVPKLPVFESYTSAKPLPFASVKLSTIPLLSESKPPTSTTSWIPSLSASKSWEFGTPSPSKSGLPSPTFPVPSTFPDKPSPSTSLKLSIIPLPFSSTPPTSITSGIPSLSESKSKALGMPSPSESPNSAVSKIPSLSSSKSVVSFTPSLSLSRQFFEATTIWDIELQVPTVTVSM